MTTGEGTDPDVVREGGLKGFVPLLQVKGNERQKRPQSACRATATTSILSP